MAPPLPFRDAFRGMLASSARAASAGLSRLAAALPFSGGAQPPANTPRIEWLNDQPSPPPPGGFIRDYHDHTFHAFSQPTNYDGFDVARTRRAISLLRQGICYEASMLSVAMCGFGPILSALGRRMGPILRLPKHVTGGTRGLSRIVAADLDAQLCPARGLADSQYFPSSTLGGCIFDKATMNFFVLQHVAGPEDPLTGHRMIWTRRWPTWAVIFNPYRHTFQAQTDSGPVDILNDGKFTLGADVDDPHLTANVIALGEEAVDGKQTQRARASWIKMYGNPKWWGEMPPDIAPDSDIGRALFAAIGTVRNQDGFGVGPNGAKLDIKGLSTGQSDGFSTALASNMAIVAMLIDGSDAPSAPTGTGVYPSPHKFATANAMTDRDIWCMNRAMNVGPVAVYLSTNYTAGLAEEKEAAAEEEAQAAAGVDPGPIDKAKARGIWTDPVFEIGPMPDPEADTRIKSYSDRMKAAAAQVVAERDAGMLMDQGRVEQIYAAHEVTAPTLANQKPKGAQIYEWHVTNKQVAPDELRDRLDLPIIPHGAGSLERLAQERLAGKDEVGKAASEGDPLVPEAPPPGEPAEPTAVPEGGARRSHERGAH